MSINTPYITSTQVAQSVPYNDTLVAPTTGDTNVQSIIDYLKNASANGASPGFTWGRSGNVGSGTYLLNDSVPSNAAGRTVLLTSASITDVAYANDTVSTFNLKIEEHDGVTFTTLGTFTITAGQAGRFQTNLALTTNKMIAVSVSSGSAHNLVVSLVLKGTI
jgi:hypothetical protein